MKLDVTLQECEGCNLDKKKGCGKKKKKIINNKLANFFDGGLENGCFEREKKTVLRFWDERKRLVALPIKTLQCSTMPAGPRGLHTR